eukprot:TRINITY_DN10463_c0_g1_i2.p1 TRINITY_DN10463_c0_g1~~TRINITY_DN10463_c0_g1_i2.p1  ORF type:complete len:1522 (-),score=274.97 TRINITY_DN10463_c0_g1_i2:738-5303(-)
MSRRSSTNHKDPSEGIRQALGKHVKILLKSSVKLEKGNDKTDNRILVFSPHRLFVMTAKVPTKIDHHFHYLDIQAIESKKPNQVVFRINDRNYTFRPGVETNSSDPIDAMIITVARAIRSIFPGVMLSHVIPKVDVVPVKRIQSVLEMKPLDFKDMGPCGGFSTQYACYCDYYNMPYREEVAWDVDTIYFSHDSHELCLADFEHLDQRDLNCIISALEHNTWFTKLRASANTQKLANEVLDKILAVVSKSMSLQEIHLSSAGLRWDFFQRLATSMSSNQYCNLTTLDISLNFVEDRGLANISNVLSHFPRGTKHINLAHCTLTGKGINALTQALVTNKLSLNSLTYLNLAGNNLREEVQNLVNFLAQPNVVSILDLSSTDVPSEILFSALVRGCTTHLSHLNLARNPFTAKKSKGDIPSTFKQFFATTLGLKYLNLSHCKLPIDALKHLLLGLACNESTSDVELNISNNNLGALGASVMENALPGVTCVSRLDVSENNLDVELASVVNGVARNKSLLSLNISKNLPKIKARDVVHVMEAIVQLIQEEETSLQKLNLSDCKLKTDINNVINALGSNQCLQVLDISGNGMGDVGARLLAKALQINTRLRTVHLDRNNISLQGYQDITYALQSNFSMKHIPFPTYDLQPAMKTSPERVDAIIRRMQENLQRNSNPRSFGSKNQNFRLTQGFLLSSTQQVLDKWCAQVQDTVQTVNRDCNEPTIETQQAAGFIKDAEKCKLLLSSLHETTARRDETCPITTKLQQISTDLESFLTDHISTSVNNMLATTQELCPNVIQHNSKSLQDLQVLSDTKSRIPKDFVKNLVNDTIGVEVYNKVNEMNLILANHISDKVIDDVIDNLARTYKGLVGDLGSMKKKRSLTPDVLKGSSQRLDSQSESDAFSQAGDNYSQKSSPSPISTPHISKRKSVHDRKLRPKSVVDGSEDYAPDLLTHMQRTELDQSIEEQDSVPELPEIPQLQHLAKNRPKRPKKHASTKNVLKLAEGGDSEDIKEGLDTFFAKSLTPNQTPIGSPLFEELHSSRHGSISSASSHSIASRSKEDLRMKVGTSGKISPLMFDNHGRRSPAETQIPNEMTSSKYKQLFKPEESKREEQPSIPLRDEPTRQPQPQEVKSRGGLSCLKPATLDDDLEPLTKSPERKPMMSPSGRSISDIFGKVAQDKLKSKTNDRTPPGTSPFTARRSETEVFTSKRRSFFTGEPNIQIEEKSPDEGEGGSDDVVKRTKTGVGLGGDILAEMRVKQEKRASVIPKTSDIANVDNRAENKDDENPFGGIKLRSTGRASNLTSPTSDFSPENPKSFQADLKNSENLTENAPEKIKHSSSSIIGLRAANLDASKSKNDLSEVEESRPRPPPKPRPWSIVGVDRKSGEYTQVDGGTITPPSPTEHSPDLEEKLEKGERRGSLANRGSVRDMIANLNKPEKEGLGSVGGLLGAQSVRDRIASMNKGDPEPQKKGNSLPRNTEGVSSSAKSPGIKPKNSPHNFRKESTTDDPRILKLDDDFMYEDTVNV